ncbi:MAG: YciI family protein [Usitatibacter sp.]
MRYLCLAYYDEKKFDSMPRNELDAIVSQCRAHDEALRESGHLVSVASLESPRKATSVRPSKGRSLVIDGPYAETKEQLGSFFIIEAKDMDEAVRVASMHPAARLGEQLGWGIEVRGIDFER